MTESREVVTCEKDGVPHYRNTHGLEPNGREVCRRPKLVTACNGNSWKCVAADRDK